MPAIESFDGKQDPGDHVMNFRAKMCLLSAPDEILCRAFPTTLKGPASVWYSHLEPGSIYSFSKLSKLFVSNFAGTRKPKKPATYLFTVRQESGESLKKYLSRFNSELLDIDEKDDTIAVAAFIAGLAKGPLLQSFVKRSPRSMTELLDRAQVRIIADDHMNCRDEADRKRHSPRRRESPGRSRKRRDRTPERDRSDRRREGKDNRGKSDYTPKYKDFTPLSASIRQVLSVIKHDADIPWPKPISHGKGRKFCDFHQSRGHDTADCSQLKDEIERRIQKGELTQFRADCEGKETFDLREKISHSRGKRNKSRDNSSQSRETSRERSRTPRRERGPPLERGSDSGANVKGRDVINTIFGGFASGGTSNSQRKQHVRKIARVGDDSVNAILA